MMNSISILHYCPYLSWWNLFLLLFLLYSSSLLSHRIGSNSFCIPCLLMLTICASYRAQRTQRIDSFSSLSSRPSLLFSSPFQPVSILNRISSPLTNYILSLLDLHYQHQPLLPSLNISLSSSISGFRITMKISIHLQLIWPSIYSKILLLWFHLII